VWVSSYSSLKYNSLECIRTCETWFQTSWSDMASMVLRLHCCGLTLLRNARLLERYISNDFGLIHFCRKCKFTWESSRTAQENASKPFVEPPHIEYYAPFRMQSNLARMFGTGGIYRYIRRFRVTTNDRPNVHPSCLDIVNKF
jgi:hypothetical protein